jgi:ABC-2 type transport system ATP-binding protein
LGQQSPVDLFSALPDIAEVETLNEQNTHLTLIPKDGQEIFEHVQQFIKEKGWHVKQLYIEPGRLDEVFRQMTQEVQ